MYYDPIYKNEAIYIAGPECFYTYGYPHWHALKARAEMFGFSVTMPNSDSVSLGNEDKRKDADAIFANCVKSIEASTVIIADLEFYRGPDVDGGSVYEIGMAYGNGCRCYGYTRDLREMRFKYQGSVLKNNCIYDRKGRLLPFANLPFSANVFGPCKIAEGDFDDALRLLLCDITDERKLAKYPRVKKRIESITHKGAPVIYLAGPERYDSDVVFKYKQMRAACERYGFRAITPLDDVEELSSDPYVNANQTFKRNVYHVRTCDVILANLNDFHGWEPDADTSFECGLAYSLGKKMFGYMSDARKMIDRVPNYGKENEYRDQCGCNAEDFDYPINCMFASSMPIVEGNFEDALQCVVKSLLST